jgi:GNAT superfamily N-acetyltransferase
MSFPSGLDIVSATSTEQLGAVKALFQEYWNSFGFTPSFQNFGSELAALPGKYQPPQGRLALALVRSEPAGCVALRPIDAIRCEAKRLYVRPRFRSQGVGKALLEWVISEARSAGYEELVGDTMPVMERAIAMYERIGFERTGPYANQPTGGAIYVRLRLNPPAIRRILGLE